MDEAAIGVNAYSILKTAKDEHGVFLPLAFKSVGDYKPPVDIYLTVISEFVFGLNEFAVRFPVAFFGTLTCLVLVFFFRALKVSWIGSLGAGFWLALLPWHIHFSRGSFEAVTALFFLVTGLWLFFRWLNRKRTVFLPAATAAFGLSVWSYHAERFFVPLLALFLVLFFRKHFNLKERKIRHQVFLAGLILVLLALPFLKLAFLTPAIAQRAAVTSILREASLIDSLHQGHYANLIQKIFDPDCFLIFRHWFGKYLNYYDLRFWFWKGLQFTPPGYPDLGLLLAADLPLFLYGIYALIHSRNKPLRGLALFWFWAGPLSASFTMNERHPLRALVWLPFFGLTIAAGLERFWHHFKVRWLLFFYGMAVGLNLVYFGDIYLNQFPRYYSESWQYGYKEIAKYICAHRQNYDRILVSDTFGSLGPLNTGTPYLYLLFYCPENMQYFLTTGKQFGQIDFRRPNSEAAKQKGKLLLVGSPWDFLDGNLYGGKIVKRVVYPSGIDAFWMVEKNGKN
jgi:hypothetical protein